MLQKSVARSKTHVYIYTFKHLYIPLFLKVIEAGMCGILSQNLDSEMELLQRLLFISVSEQLHTNSAYFQSCAASCQQVLLAPLL